MITGFNTEVKYNDITFHVQTEDRGIKVARIDTIIYRSGGAIVHRKQIFYDDILECDCLEEVIKELMEDTHTLTIGEISRGLWTLGADAMPKKTFHNVILKYLLEPVEVTGLQ